MSPITKIIIHYLYNYLHYITKIVIFTLVITKDNNIMNLTIPIEGQNKTLATLTLVNPVIGNLTPRELKILSIMLDNNVHIIESRERDLVRHKLDMDKYSFNNCIMSLKKKGVIKQTITDIRVNSALNQFKNLTALNINFQESQS